MNYLEKSFKNIKNTIMYNIGATELLEKERIDQKQYLKK